MDSFEKKSNKKTTSHQFQMLVKLMQTNIRLAKCLPATSRIDKISVENAWDDVARKVNSCGPPVRTVSEWKKVWADLKSRTKKKIFETNKSNSEGGYCPKPYLSELEQSIDKILNFSGSALQLLDESSEDLTFENNIYDPLKVSEIKTENYLETAPNIQISESAKTFATKKRKSMPQIRLIGKRKYEKTEKQLKLLQDQIKAQEKNLEAIQIQAAATKVLAEAASRQAEAMTVIAESTQSIAIAIQDAVKYLKSK